MYKITTNGITDGKKPFCITCKTEPFITTITKFKELLLLRGFELPKNLVCINGTEKIVFKYSFNETADLVERVELVFKVEKI